MLVCWILNKCYSIVTVKHNSSISYNLLCSITLIIEIFESSLGKVLIQRTPHPNTSMHWDSRVSINLSKKLQIGEFCASDILFSQVIKIKLDCVILSGKSGCFFTPAKEVVFLLTLVVSLENIENFPST